MNPTGRSPDNWWRKQWIATAYLLAQSHVWSAGYADECRSWRQQAPEDITEYQFLREAAWVVLSSGMRESVVRSRFPGVSEAFRWWRSAAEIASDGARCVDHALQCFQHRPKMRAIVTIAEQIADAGMDTWRHRMAADPIGSLRSLPFMGPATACHLAKNLGCDVAKPDRHLSRIAAAAGFDSAHDLCSAIAAFTGQPRASVDSVLWRYATLVPDYASRFAFEAGVTA